MEERKLTEKESLEVITSMIARTKVRYIGNGNILLMWGCLVVLISILVWVMLAITHDYVCNWLWFAIPLIGFPVTIVMVRKERRDRGAITYSDRITSRLWTIFGVSEMVLALICLGFALFGRVNCWDAMLLYSILMGPGTEIAQGLIIKEKCLVGGGMIGLAVGLITVCCVAGSVPLSVNWYIPLFISAFVAMMIIPGYIINRNSKQK